MRGVKYNLSIEVPHGEKLIFNDIDMTKTCETIKKTFLERYFLDIKCNNQTVYNLYKRPKNVNRLLKNFIEVERVN